MLKFYWNGIKDNGGKLQTCHYQRDSSPSEYSTLTIYKRDYHDFSLSIREAFKVHDDSDPTSDYIVREYIRVAPDHALYAEVYKAYQAQEEHRARRACKRSRFMESRA